MLINQVADLVKFVRKIYSNSEEVPLHAPYLDSADTASVVGAMESGWVSSAGKAVEQFEYSVGEYIGAPGRVVSCVNGTGALHAALTLANVSAGDYVITQALTFVGTCNAIHMAGADPIFCDVSSSNFGLCPVATRLFLESNCEVLGEHCVLKKNGRKIKALLPVHVFGHPASIIDLIELAREWRLTVIEDAAEAMGTHFDGHHLGTLGDFGILSFNGNKIITTGGGGALICKNSELATEARRLVCTAKDPHPYEFFHSKNAFNYRMPNLNAALGVSQLAKLGAILNAKRRLARVYETFFVDTELKFITEPANAYSNFWLNGVICDSYKSRTFLVEELNRNGIFARPAWRILTRLPMYSSAERGCLIVSVDLSERIVNLPSGYKDLDLDFIANDECTYGKLL